jgi:hypothetical protein
MFNKVFELIGSDGLSATMANCQYLLNMLEIHAKEDASLKNALIDSVVDILQAHKTKTEETKQ